VIPKQNPIILYRYVIRSHSASFESLRGKTSSGDKTMQKPKILVVDDQPTFLKTVCLGLECLQAIGVALGGAALEALRKHPDTSLALEGVIPDTGAISVAMPNPQYQRVGVV
jgi:hypothetical protein